MFRLSGISSWRIGVALVLAALAAGTIWFAASPRWAVEGLLDAARNRDQSELVHRIDIEKVRASLQDQLTPSTAGDRQGALGRLGADIVDAVSAPMINTIVTHRTVSEAFLQLENGEKPEAYRIERKGLNAFVVRSTGKRSLFAFRFVRKGLSWVLTEQFLDHHAQSNVPRGAPGSEH